MKRTLSKITQISENKGYMLDPPQWNQVPGESISCNDIMKFFHDTTLPLSTIQDYKETEETSRDRWYKHRKEVWREELKN